jgi:hypothetical protein
LRRDLVADEPDQARRRQEPEMRQRARVDEALDGLTERNQGADD